MKYLVWFFGWIGDNGKFDGYYYYWVFVWWNLCVDCVWVEFVIWGGVDYEFC